MVREEIGPLPGVTESITLDDGLVSCKAVLKWLSIEPKQHAKLVKRAAAAMDVSTARTDVQIDGAHLMYLMLHYAPRDAVNSFVSSRAATVTATVPRKDLVDLVDPTLRLDDIEKIMITQFAPSGDHGKLDAGLAFFLEKHKGMLWRILQQDASAATRDQISYSIMRSYLEQLKTMNGLLASYLTQRQYSHLQKVTGAALGVADDRGLLLTASGFTVNPFVLSAKAAAEQAKKDLPEIPSEKKITIDMDEETRSLGISMGIKNMLKFVVKFPELRKAVVDSGMHKLIVKICVSSGAAKG